MKKLFVSLMFLFLFVFSLASCDSKKPVDENPEPETPTDTETETPKEEPNVDPSESLGFVIHYQRNDEKYNEYGMWLWENGKDGALHEFNGNDSYGYYIKYEWSKFSENLINDKLGFIVRRLDSWTKDVESDRFIIFSNYKPSSDKYYHIYLKTGDAKIYTSEDGEVNDLIQSYYLTYNPIIETLTIWFQTNKEFSSYKITLEDEVVYSSETQEGNANLMSATKTRVMYKLDEFPDITKPYKLSVTFKESGKTLTQESDMSSLYSTPQFEEKYAYDGKLGAIYSETSTTFRVWSPISSSIKLRIYQTGTPLILGGSDEYQEYTMTSDEKGTWEAKVSGDLSGKYYTYVVTNNVFNEKEIVDPYAKSAGINGLRGMVVNFAATNPEGWNDINIHNYPSQALTVYETHIADLTSSTTWNGTKENAKLFKGFYEAGTSYKGVTTGFDHIKELGVNAVQLIPIFDQANDERVLYREFNWGYNPLNYNVLEGSYSSDPFDGYTRIKEFKELVMAYNEAGINIIMDVVYNHVNGLEGSNFDVLMPRYYYRYTSSGPSNGSGCGNETASERYMYRKFMIDSTEFWASEYKLGGFRFDLMGIHDIETMNLLTENLHTNVNKAITVYGEPWAGGTISMPNTSTPANQANMSQFDGYGCFNDKMRDALIKGGLCGKEEKGWITENTEVSASDVAEIKSGIIGNTHGVDTSGDTYKCVNYVTCHDNYTLYDRIKATGITDEATIKKMAMLANSVVFTSQGISFMLAGEEFLRTKGGNDNSYNSTYKVNELDYELKVNNMDMFENYKKLIALKQNSNLFGLSGEASKSIKVTASCSNSLLVYDIVDTQKNISYRIIHSNGYESTTAKTVNLEGYTLYLDTLNIENLELTNETAVAEYQTIIAYKSLS